MSDVNDGGDIDISAKDQKQLAKERRREAYLRAKERQKSDPAYIAQKEKAKAQRREAYRQQKERMKEEKRREKADAESEKLRQEQELKSQVLEEIKNPIATGGRGHLRLVINNGSPCE